MKKIIYTLLFLLTSIASFAQLFFEENFSYTTGQLTAVGSGANVSGGNWVNASGTGSPITVVSGNLTYTGYASSGVGNHITIVSPTSSGEDVRRGFTDQLSTANAQLYAGFLVNITNRINLLVAPTSGDYFAHFTNVAGTGGGFHSRLYIRPSGNGVNFGLQTNTALTTTWTTTNYDTGVTYLIIIGYEIVASGADTGRLWVNPTLGGSTPPTPTLILPVTTGTEPDGIDAFGIRQGTNTPNAQIDGIRVSRGWFNGALPVSWKSINVSSDDNGNLVKWSTANETNNSHFEVQRSADGKHFETIAKVKGKGTTSKVSYYSYNDIEGTQTDAAYYRLKQIDFDGKFEYSKVVSIQNKEEEVQSGITTTLPNPFNDELVINVQSGANTSATVQVIDMIGKTHKVQTQQFVKGANKIEISTEDMPNGIYFVRINSNGEVFTKKVIKK